jgi:hypothetical protein
MLRRSDFPTEGEYLSALRDWFAGQALAGMVADPNRSGDLRSYGEWAYRYADAMLAAREAPDAE